MSLRDQLKQDQKEMGRGSDFFKFAEGDNRIRVMAMPKVVASHFLGGKGVTCYGMTKGCPHDHDKIDTKWLTWVLHEGTLKLARLPWTVVDYLANLEANPEYSFTEYPMPYDIIVTAKGAGTMDVEYTPIAARQNTPVDEVYLNDLRSKKTPEEIVDEMKRKQAAADGNGAKLAPDAEANPGDIPF